MGPRTVAQCLTGSKDSPSRMCHSTLYVVSVVVIVFASEKGEKGTVPVRKGKRDIRAVQLPEDFVKERNTGYHALNSKNEVRSGG